MLIYFLKKQIPNKLINCTVKIRFIKETKIKRKPTWCKIYQECGGTQTEKLQRRRPVSNKDKASGETLGCRQGQGSLAYCSPWGQSQTWLSMHTRTHNLVTQVLKSRNSFLALVRGTYEYEEKSEWSGIAGFEEE